MPIPSLPAQPSILPGRVAAHELGPPSSAACVAAAPRQASLARVMRRQLCHEGGWALGLERMIGYPQRSAGGRPPGLCGGTRARGRHAAPFGGRAAGRAHRHAPLNPTTFREIKSAGQAAAALMLMPLPDRFQALFHATRAHGPRQWWRGACLNTNLGTATLGPPQTSKRGAKGVRHNNKLPPPQQRRLRARSPGRDRVPPAAAACSVRAPPPLLSGRCTNQKAQMA